MFSFKTIGFAEQEYFLSQFKNLKDDPEKILNLEIPASKKQDYLKLALYNGHEYLCIKLLSMGADLPKALSELSSLKDPRYQALFENYLNLKKALKAIKKPEALDILLPELSRLLSVFNNKSINWEYILKETAGFSPADWKNGLLESAAAQNKEDLSLYLLAQEGAYWQRKNPSKKALNTDAKEPLKTKIQQWIDKAWGPHQACLRGNVDLLQSLKINKILPSYKSNTGHSLAYYIVISGNISRFQVLLRLAQNLEDLNLPKTSVKPPDLSVGI